MNFRAWPLLLVVFMAAKCPKEDFKAHENASKRAIPDNFRRESAGSNIARASTAAAVQDYRCKKMDERAQNVFIQWGRDRKLEGQPLDLDLASKMMGVASWESGGKHGLGFSNITPHMRERVAGGPNKAGYDGETESHVLEVEGYLENPKKQKFIDHQMNFGAGQISPDVFNNYPATKEKLKNFASIEDSEKLFSTCISDIAYAAEDHGEVKNQLSKLSSRRDEIDSWVNTIGSISRKHGRNQSAARRECNRSSSCMEATKNLGRWLAYCPRLNLEAKEVVFTTNKNYYARTTRRAPPVCEETLRAEINKFNFTDPQFYYVGTDRFNGTKGHIL